MQSGPALALIDIQRIDTDGGLLEQNLARPWRRQIQLFELHHFGRT
jgi:hypothetical protein